MGVGKLWGVASLHGAHPGPGQGGGETGETEAGTTSGPRQGPEARHGGRWMGLWAAYPAGRALPVGGQVSTADLAPVADAPSPLTRPL